MMKKLATVLLVLVIIGLTTSVYLLQKQVQELINTKADVENYQVKTTEFKKALPSTNFSEVDLPINQSVGFREISKLITQSVVYIESEVELVAKMPNDNNHNNLLDRFGSRPRSTSIGSGVLISDDGFILTNNHVIEGAINNKVTVVLNDNRIFSGTVLGTDLSTDIAVVKIAGDGIKGIKLADSDDVQVGDWVLAVGNPFRLRSTVTAGIVSALSRDVSIIENRMKIENFIQTDAAINKGNSGGALVDDQGNLIGINTAIATETGTYEGYGFAIPINMASKIARDIIEFGKVQRAYLGVQIVSLSAQRAKELGMNTISGVEIVATIESGAAKEAGLKPGDVVLAINQRSVSAHNELQAKIAEFRPGDIINVSVWDNGKEALKQVTLKGADNEEIKNWLGEENNQQENPNNDSVEFYQEKITKDLIVAIERKADLSKLFIDELTSGSEFEQSGLLKGDQLVEINGKPIRNETDLKIHFQHYRSKKDQITFKVIRDFKEGFFTLPEFK